MRSSALLNNENDGKYCFIWSIGAKPHPISDPKYWEPTRVSNYTQCFNELNIEGFDFTNGFKCSDIHKSENLKKFSNDVYEFNFYQDQNFWKHKLLPIQVSKNN